MKSKPEQRERGAELNASASFKEMIRDMGLYFDPEFSDEELKEFIGAQLRGERGREFRRAFLNRLLVEIVGLLMEKEG